MSHGFEHLSVNHSSTLAHDGILITEKLTSLQLAQIGLTSVGHQNKVKRKLTLPDAA